ncbi:MAG: hypothetical protein ACXWUL_07005 [Caldimonas sp.]
MTKSELPQSLGAFNPVGHAVLAFASDEVAAQARQALADAGFADQDLLVYGSGELFPNLKEMMRNASGAAGFGYQIQLMRRYMTLASENAGWVVVYAPDEEQIAKVQALAKRLGARSAVHYGNLAQEDLV